jgi:protocatechuate 3,4-dioxygenase beta subunit
MQTSTIRILAVALILTSIACLNSRAQAPKENATTKQDASLQREREAEPLYQAAVKAAESNADQKKVLDDIEAALKAGACSARTLTESAFASLHTTTRFHELMRDHARRSDITITLPKEPGEKLRVNGVVRDTAGKPVAGAIVFAYHTDTRGYYNDLGMDTPRIFGYMRTDAEGRYAFNSIRPAKYPDVGDEQHIHYEVTAAGYRELVTESGFADDPFWKGKTLPARALKVTKDERGVFRCQFDMTLQKARS